MWRFLLLVSVLLTVGAGVSAQTADEIISKYVEKIGGMQKVEAIKRPRTGKYVGGGGFEAIVTDESKRPNLSRNEFNIQGMTGVTSFDGRTGWKIQPWNGKKDAESLSEDELKGYLDGDFERRVACQLQTQKYKGRISGQGRVRRLGRVQAQGDAAKRHGQALLSGYRLLRPDQDRDETNRSGADVETETVLGDYKEVSGLYFPFSQEFGPKGSANKEKIIYEKIEANVPLDDIRFAGPAEPSVKKTQ